MDARVDVTLTSLHQAIADNRFADIATICDGLELQTPSFGFANEQLPYAIHLLGFLYNNDLGNARFLWKRIPTPCKSDKSEVAAVWSVGEAMWKHNREGTYKALGAFNWSEPVRPVLRAVADQCTNRMLSLISKSYTTIAASDMAVHLGVPKEVAVSMAVGKGFTYDSASEMLTVSVTTTPSEQQVQLNHLQKLTEYVFHLEH